MFRLAMSNTYDVIAIGGGPAGSTAAAILAEYGHRVLVLEREKFPRYHIGESLIPFTFLPLQRLGLIEKMRESHFVKKYSVRFVDPDGRSSQPFYFFNRYDRDTIAQTWQVLRSEFDEMLLDHARSKGAEVREETKVVGLLRNEAGAVTGVKAVGPDGQETEYRAALTLDCTGKEAYSMVRNGWKVRDPYLNKVAVWTYYRGAKRGEGIDEGETVVAYVREKGWFWYIPQHNDMVSVGVVAEGKYLSRDGVRQPEQIFQREIEENQWIKEHLSVGQQVGDYYVTNEFTHHSRYCGSEGLLLLGDAYAFLDPVFSSGVMLALKSGMLAAEEIHRAIEEGDLGPHQFDHYAKTIRRSVENMRKLVYAFYDQNFSFSELIKRHPDAAGPVADCLSGDMDKDYSDLWDQIREFVTLPDDLDLGEPLLENDAQAVTATR